jgi:hypothetical protein
MGANGQRDHGRQGTIRCYPRKGKLRKGESPDFSTFDITNVVARVRELVWRPDAYCR